MIVPLIYFVLLSFLFQLCINFLDCLSCNSDQCPCGSLFSDMVIITDVLPHNWGNYFQDSGLPLSFSGTWSGSICDVNSLARTSGIMQMLYRMAVQLIW